MITFRGKKDWDCLVIESSYSPSKKQILREVEDREDKSNIDYITILDIQTTYESGDRRYRTLVIYNKDNKTSF